MLRATLVDDFVLKPLRSPQDEDFHDLIAERSETAATILTSNLDFSEWGDAFAGKRILGAVQRASYRLRRSIDRRSCARHISAGRKAFFAG
jgi:DNA replication protein DnaC